MYMAFIKNFSELPEWFDLSNYTSTYHHLDADTIFKGLVFRKALLRSLGETNSSLIIKDLGVYDPWKDIHDLSEEHRKNLPDIFSNYIEYVKKVFHLIIADPLKSYTWHETLLKLDNSFLYNSFHLAATEYWEKATHPEPIKSLSILDIGKNFYSLPMPLRYFLRSKYLANKHETSYISDSDITDPIYENLISRFKNLIELEFNEDEYPGHSLEGIKLGLLLNDFCENELYGFLNSYKKPYLGNPLIEIDLGCSDNLITEKFQIWLKNIRAKNNVEIVQNNNSQTTIGKIKNYQVFAFMDLYIWSLLTNNKIQNCVYIDALYPHSTIEDSYIKKSLIPFINRLLDPQSQEISNLLMETNKK